MNILVTAVGGDLGQSVIKCLKNSDCKDKIFGCDMETYAAGQALCHGFFTAPPVSDEVAYKDFIAKTIKENHIDYVFPMSNVEISFISSQRHFFEKLPARFVMNPSPIIERFMDKYLTVQFFRENGIPAPQTYLAETFDGQLEFPVILKKRQGSGSQGLFKVADDEELKFFCKRHQDMIVQQYLPGENNEYTSCIFSDGHSHHFITFKRKLAPGGYSNYVELIIDEMVDSFLLKVAEVLNFKGSINIQFRIVEGVCYPFEINPRFSSTVYFRHCFGFKDVLWSMDLMENKPIQYGPVKKKGIGVKSFDEVFFDLE